MSFKLFSDCKIVKGWTRSCVYNFSKSNYILCPNEFYDEFVSGQDYSNDFKDFCAEEGIGMYFPESVSSHFNDLNLDWDWSAKITNCILEIDDNFLLDKIKFIEQAGCIDFQIVIQSLNLEFCKEIILNINSILDRSKSVELICIHSKDLSDFILSEINSIFEQSKIKSLILLGANENRVLHEAKGGMYLVIESTSSISEFNSYRNLSEEYFTVNLPLFTESLMYNNYFNRKLIVNSQGYLVNSLDDVESDFNLNSISSESDLNELIKNMNLNSFSTVSKDKCDVCKDCEFRYMCVDSRIPVKKMNGDWFFNEECNYNPYICKWSGEEGYVNLLECGVVSNEDSFTVEIERINQIVNHLWGQE